MSKELGSRAEWERVRTEAFRAPWLDPARERDLLPLAQAGDRPAMSELCASHMRLVVQIAAHYRGNQFAPEDLVGEGAVGLVEAIHRFDDAQTTRLSTYAAWWIRARIRHFVWEQRSAVSPPSPRGVRVARSRLAATERVLTRVLGRPLTVTEIAAHLEVPEADVFSVQRCFAGSTSSLESTVSRSGIVPRDERAGPEELVASEEMRARIEHSVRAAVAKLPARERSIVDAHFLREESSLADIGETLGVSRQRVSQIVHGVCKKLERELARVAC